MNDEIGIEDRDRELVGEYVGSSPAGVWGPHNVNDLAAFAAWLRTGRRNAPGTKGTMKP